MLLQTNRKQTKTKYYKKSIRVNKTYCLKKWQIKLSLSTEHEKSLSSIAQHQENASKELKKHLLINLKKNRWKGLSNFSDGFKELVGFDIMGTFDGATKKLNALGKVFGGDGVLGDKIMGNLGRVMQDAGKGIGKSCRKS